MKELTKRAVRRAAAVVSAVVCISLAAGHISLEDLTNWSRTAALLSAGLMQPEGGAEALSARLDREPGCRRKGDAGVHDHHRRKNRNHHGGHQRHPA